MTRERSAPLVPEDHRSDLGIAVIGMGRWGRRIIRVFAEHANVVICCNRGDPAAKQWLRDVHPSIEHTTEVGVVLGHPGVEAVVIATPIASHADLAVAALSAGKHVFVEKPLATSVRECDRAIEAAERADRRLFVGHTFLYDAALQALRQRTAIDPVRDAQLVWHKVGTFEEPLVWNLLPHEVAIAVWLMGGVPSGVEIQEARASVTVLDRLRATLAFPGGRRSAIEIDRTREARRKTVSLTTASGTRYRWSDGSLRTLAGSMSQRLHETREEPLAREARAFLASVAGAESPESDGSFARLVTSIIEEVERQTVTGKQARPMSLPQA
jgi:predicted dehydrogenase